MFQEDNTSCFAGEMHSSRREHVVFVSVRTVLSVPFFGREPLETVGRETFGNVSNIMFVAVNFLLCKMRGQFEAIG